MLNNGLIITNTDTWIVMRENPGSPKAIISRVTDTTGAERYMVYTWALKPHERRMAGIYESLVEAATSAPWDRRKVDINGYPPGTRQYEAAKQKLAQQSPPNAGHTAGQRPEPAGRPPRSSGQNWLRPITPQRLHHILTQLLTDRQRRRGPCAGWSISRLRSNKTLMRQTATLIVRLEIAIGFTWLNIGVLH